MYPALALHQSETTLTKVKHTKHQPFFIFHGGNSTSMNSFDKIQFLSLNGQRVAKVTVLQNLTACMSLLFCRQCRGDFQSIVTHHTRKQVEVAKPLGSASVVRAAKELNRGNLTGNTPACDENQKIRRFYYKIP